VKVILGVIPEVCAKFVVTKREVVILTQLPAPLAKSSSDVMLSKKG